MKFEVIVKTEQGLTSTITENALEAKKIMDEWAQIVANVNVIIKNRDSDEIYTSYDCNVDENGMTERSMCSITWADVINELLAYGGYTTEEVM